MKDLRREQYLETRRIYVPVGSTIHGNYIEFPAGYEATKGWLETYQEWVQRQQEQEGEAVNERPQDL